MACIFHFSPSVSDLTVSMTFPEQDFYSEIPDLIKDFFSFDSNPFSGLTETVTQTKKIILGFLKNPDVYADSVLSNWEALNDSQRNLATKIFYVLPPDNYVKQGLINAILALGSSEQANELLPPLYEMLLTVASPDEMVDLLEKCRFSTFLGSQALLDFLYRKHEKCSDKCFAYFQKRTSYLMGDFSLLLYSDVESSDFKKWIVLGEGRPDFFESPEMEKKKVKECNIGSMCERLPGENYFQFLEMLSRLKTDWATAVVKRNILDMLSHYDFDGRADFINLLANYLQNHVCQKQNVFEQVISGFRNKKLFDENELDEIDLRKKHTTRFEQQAAITHLTTNFIRLIQNKTDLNESVLFSRSSKEYLDKLQKTYIQYLDFFGTGKNYITYMSDKNNCFKPLFKMLPESPKAVFTALETTIFGGKYNAETVADFVLLSQNEELIRRWFKYNHAIDLAKSEQLPHLEQLAIELPNKELAARSLAVLYDCVPDPEYRNKVYQLFPLEKILQTTDYQKTMITKIKELNSQEIRELQYLVSNQVRKQDPVGKATAMYEPLQKIVFSGSEYWENKVEHPSDYDRDTKFIVLFKTFSDIKKYLALGTAE